MAILTPVIKGYQMTTKTLTIEIEIPDNIDSEIQLLEYIRDSIQRVIERKRRKL